VPSDGMAEAFNKIRAGKFSFEERALITSFHETKKGTVAQNALNDIVISRGTVPRLIELEVRVNNEPLTRYRCDGLIVSSPTGSTAYSLAAGGAVVYPTADVFALTPICAHTLSNRSVLLNLDATIEVRLVSARTTAILSADGQIATELKRNDSVRIKRSQHSIRLLTLEGSSFFQTLRAKLHWRGTNF
jgi:NAD+ kinase